MRPLVATTGGRAVAEAGAAALAAGGNAVDAVAAAALAWPPTLASSGALVAAGAGLGRVACRMPGRIPGMGLSRPRRVRLFTSGAPASAVAAPCAASGLASALARWGRTGIEAAVAAAMTQPDPPHGEALSLLADQGVTAFVKGTWALAAARAFGPLAGGLLTRRDLIEARPELGPAWIPPDRSEPALSSPGPLGPGGRRAVPGGAASPRRTLAVAALDREGSLAALALDAGPGGGEIPAPVAGVEANSLLRGQPHGTARKVGRALPLACAAAVSAAGPREPLALAGAAAAMGAVLRPPGFGVATVEADLAALGPRAEGLLALGFGPDGPRLLLGPGSAETAEP